MTRASLLMLAAAPFALFAANPALAEAQRKGVPANEEAQVRARREIAQWCGSR